MAVGYSYKVTVKGQLGTPALDTWQWGVNFARTAPPLTEPAMPTVGQLTTLYTTFLVPYHQNVDLALSTRALLRSVKVALIDPDGEYATDAVEYEAAAGTAGGASGGADVGVPAQVAMGITLWSGSNIGKQNFGRYYLPMPSGPLVTATMGVAPATAAAIATASKTCLNGIRTMIRGLTDAGTMELMVVPADRSLDAKVVNYVRCGTLKDTQRRRRNNLPEAPQLVAYP